MKKRNVVLHTAIASALLAMAGAASAGNLSASNTVFATEVFGPTFTATTGIRPGPITHTITASGGIVINAGGKIYYSVRLVNGTFSVAPLLAQLTGTALAVGGGGNGVVSDAVLSTDRTTATFAITYTANATLGVGSTLVYTPIAAAVDGVNSTMAVASTTITATTSLSAVTPAVVAPSLTTTPNTGTALSAELDGGVTTAAVVATSTPAVVFAVTPSSSFPLGYSLIAGTGVGQAGVLETGRVDLLAVSPGSRFTTPGATLSNANSATVINLGAVVMGNTAGVQVKADGTTAYLINGSVTANKLGGTVVGAFKTGSTMQLTTDAACTTAVATAPTGAFTLGTTFTFTDSTVPGIAALEGASVPSFICLTTPGTTGTVTLGAATANFAVTAANHVATTDAGNTASGTLYNLRQNGATVTVRNYMPASFAPGFSQVIRIINNGTSTAQVSVAVINDSTGVTGAAVPVGSPVAAGGVMRLSQSQIETALGAAIDSTSRPRLVFTAPTSSMEAQSLMLSNGVYTNLSSIE